MRIVYLVTLTVLVATFAGIAGAQTREEMERCRTIEDDARRLACYDAISLSTGPPRTKYEPVELEELKSFALSYRGQLVEVTGWLTRGDDFLFLGLDESDDRPVPINFESISRRDRRAFLEECGEACAAVVQGRVRPVNFTTGIVADTLVVR